MASPLADTHYRALLWPPSPGVSVFSEGNGDYTHCARGEGGSRGVAVVGLAAAAATPAVGGGRGSSTAVAWESHHHHHHHCGSGHVSMGGSTGVAAPSTPLSALAQLGASEWLLSPERDGSGVMTDGWQLPLDSTPQKARHPNDHQRPPPPQQQQQQQQEEEKPSPHHLHPGGGSGGRKADGQPGEEQPADDREAQSSSAGGCTGRTPVRRTAGGCDLPGSSSTSACATQSFVAGGAGGVRGGGGSERTSPMPLMCRFDSPSQQGATSNILAAAAAQQYNLGSLLPPRPLAHTCDAATATEARRVAGLVRGGALF